MAGLGTPVNSLKAKALPKASRASQCVTPPLQLPMSLSREVTTGFSEQGHGAVAG